MSGMKIVSPLRAWEVIAGLCQQAQWIAEVGARNGKTTGFLLAHLPQLHVIAVCEKDEPAFWQALGEHHWRCRMKAMPSCEAVAEVEDASLDLAIITGSQDEPQLIKDVGLWWPKVKEGGMVVFTEFQHQYPAVHQALAACFNLLQVAVMPDSVAVVEKRDSTLFRIAA